MAMFPLTLTDIGFVANEVSILSGINFSIAAGSRTVILGANGAGKSVLMRVMHGLLEPTSGRVQWGSMATRQRTQAMVFQRPIMLRRSALANVAYGLKLAGVRDGERMERARTALTRVGLAHLADRPARVLSGGEQQRVALARAWALDPAILFLDEPTASLDPAAAAAIEQVIADIHASGTSIVMTTHNLGQARRLAEEIIFLHHGRMTEKTTAARFFAQPVSPEAKTFLEGELP